MRALRIFGWVMFGLVAATALALALGFPVMWLWNWLMPAIFGLPVISFWQAVGLLVLSHLLLKGHHPGHRHCGHHGPRDHHARWGRFAGRVKCALEADSPGPTDPKAE
jgi:hypothetical protein